MQEQDSDNTDWIINQSAVKWQQLGPKKRHRRRSPYGYGLYAISKSNTHEQSIQQCPGGISAYVITNGSPYFQVRNGKGISYSDDGTGFAYIYYYYYTTFTGSTVNVSDRIQWWQNSGGTKSDAAPSTNPTILFLVSVRQTNKRS